MKRETNIKLVTDYLEAMARGDWAVVEAMYHDDITVHMAGTTPASGKIIGKTALVNDMIQSQVHAALDMGRAQFARKWRVMCADDEAVTIIMQGGGPTHTGDNYDQTYCEIFRFADGKVIEMHAFFDTALTERCLFDNPLATERAPLANPMTF